MSIIFINFNQVRTVSLNASKPLCHYPKTLTILPPELKSFGLQEASCRGNNKKICKSLAGIVYSYNWGGI
jgi:hypothetical protein